MKEITKNNRSGFVLVLSLLTTSVLLALIISYVSRVVTDYRLTSKIHNSTAALNLAEAGIEMALWEINWGVSKEEFAPNVGTGYITGWEQSVDDYGNPVSTSSNNILQTGGLDPQTIGYYDVIVLKDQNKTYNDEVNMIYVTATGYAPSKLSPDAERTLRVTYLKNSFGRAIGAGGEGGISLGNNNLIDSYNSNDGTYDETHTNSDGNIATNGPISLPKNTDVYGDANPGADYPFDSEPAGVHGSWGTLQAPLEYDPIPEATLDGGIVEASAVNDNAGIIKGDELDPAPLDGDNNLFVGAGKTIALPGGTYYFSSITLEGGGEGSSAIMNVTGPSTIYVDTGDVSIGAHGVLDISGTTAFYVNGGGDLIVLNHGDMVVSEQTEFYVDGGDINIDTQSDINESGVPIDLAIYSTGSNITLITQSNFYGVIYAPNAAISLTSTAGGDIYGAIVCGSFASGTNTGVHFDKALLDETPPFLPHGIGSWQEIE